MEYRLALKNQKMLFTKTWVILEDIMLKEISQTQKTQIVHDLTYIWNLKEFNSKKQGAEGWFSGPGVQGKQGDAGGRGQNFIYARLICSGVCTPW